jgi:hypothetical protein
MEPNIYIHYMAILITVVATFVLGFLWYTPLFGNAWSKEMGFNREEKPQVGIIIRGMFFMLIGNFFMAYVFAHNMAVWNPVTWGLEPSPVSPSANALMAAVFTWLGFYFPNDLGSTVWEKKSWKLFWINTGYHFFNLLVAAMILANMD